MLFTFYSVGGDPVTTVVATTTAAATTTTEVPGDIWLPSVVAGIVIAVVAVVAIGVIVFIWCYVSVSNTISKVDHVQYVDVYERMNLFNTIFIWLLTACFLNVKLRSQ